MIFRIQLVSPHGRGYYHGVSPVRENISGSVTPLVTAGSRIPIEIEHPEPIRCRILKT